MDGHRESEQSFALFPLLPTELRCAIWRLCLPDRIYEVDEPRVTAIFPWLMYKTSNYAQQTPCQVSFTSKVHRHAPVITRVCREARTVALLSGGPTLHVLGSLPWSVRSFAGLIHDSDVAWVDVGCKVVHLNWTEELIAPLDMRGETDGGKGPLRYLIYRAQQIRAIGSVTLDYLDWQFDPSYADENAAETAALLKRMPEWIVVMRTIIIHTTLKPSWVFDHFGLLGDSRIQIVEATDRVRVNTLWDLALSSEIEALPEKSQRLAQFGARLPAIDEVQAELKSALYKRTETDGLEGRFKPAYMFRLCTMECNHETPVELPRSESVSWSSKNARKTRYLEKYAELLRNSAIRNTLSTPSQSLTAQSDSDDSLLDKATMSSPEPVSPV